MKKNSWIYSDNKIFYFAYWQSVYVSVYLLTAQLHKNTQKKKESIETNHTLVICNSKAAFKALAPLEAVLFDVDGTLCDSDPIHLIAFREMLLEVDCLYLF